MNDCSQAGELTQPSGQGRLLALGFGTTVSMWAVGYVCHIPPAIVPSPVVLLLLLSCLLGGGFIAGFTSTGGWKIGFQTGLIAGALNLLILGSLITGNQPNQINPSALIWIPGSFVVCSGLGTIGALAGSWFARPLSVNWTSAFSWVAVAAAFILLIIGGVVTGQEAGLAVVDWPNSFGYNMFLYPLSRMTGGIYFEHAHRLFGSLVGLTTLVLCVHLFRTDPRKWMRWLGAAALVMVIVQGIMGGLRVTGYFSWNAEHFDKFPNLKLAILHGVFGQVFFATLVSIATFTSQSWKDALNTVQTPAARLERLLTALLVVLVIAQIMTGAILRHTAQGVMVHISWAVIVILFAALCGIRAWGLYPGQKMLQRLGLTLMGVVSLQLLLGLLALFAIGIDRQADYIPTLADVILTTIHQATGAVVLAVSVMLMLWVCRALKDR